MNENGQLTEVITTYLQAVDAGQTPDPDEILAEHPELMVELQQFFTTQDRLNKLAEPLQPELPSVPRQFGDYEVLEEIARGGMGIVVRARQTSLNRVVALKMMKANKLDSMEERQRFRREAEAVALMDDPNIVPIYEVGEWRARPDSVPVPYFTMKFIEGGSLARRMKEFSDPKEAARLMAKVAHAVHYAHQRGILHRDLKPSNILLGEGDAPLVADFGLSRQLDAGLQSGLTQTGAIVGTPNYMAPEQTAGTRTALTTATDVHALGVILYELLTGSRPFQADNVLDTLLKVREQKPSSPRSVNRRVPVDLETVCLKCLEKPAGLRYGSAAELAAELERVERGEPVQARPVGRLTRGWRWCMRNRAVASLLVLVTLLLLAGTTISMLFALDAREQARLAQERSDEAERERHNAEESARKTIAAQAQFANERGLAHARKGEQDKAIEYYNMALELQADAAIYNNRGIAYAKKEEWDKAIADFTEAIRLNPDLGMAYSERGFAHGMKGEQDKAIEDYSAAIRLDFKDAGVFYHRGLGYTNKEDWDNAIPDYTEAIRLDPNFAEAYDNRGYCLGKKGDWDKAFADHDKAIRLKPSRALGYHNRGAAYGKKGEWNKAITDYTEAIRLKRDAATFFNRGIAYGKNLEWDRAIADFTEAIQIKPDMGISYFNRGIAHAAKGEQDKAIADYTRAIDLKLKDANVFYHRGLAYAKKGDWDRAIPDYDEAILIEPKNARAFNDRGNAHANRRELDKAIADYTKAISIAPDAGKIYDNRGTVYKDKEEQEKALTDFTYAIRLMLAEVKSKNDQADACKEKGDQGKANELANETTRLKPDLALAYFHRGFMHGSKGDWDKAIADFTEAIRHKPDDALARDNRGVAFEKIGELDKAITDHTEAIRLNPNNPTAYNNRGVAYGNKGDWDKALADHSKAIELNPNFAEAYNNRGFDYRNKKDWNRALADFNEAIRINAKYAEAYDNRGSTHADMGHLDKALADYTTAIHHNSTFAEAYNNRGVAYADKRELDKAIADYTTAIGINPQYAEAFKNRGSAYAEKGELDKAIADYTEAIRINGNDADAYARRGAAFEKKKDLKRAKQDLDKAKELESQNKSQPAKSPPPKDGPLGMKFVPLPKGTTYLGWNGNKGSAKKTEIKEDFEIAIYPVTQGQWQELMGNNPSAFSRQGGWKDAVKNIKEEDLKHFPVEMVSCNDVERFIKALNEKEKGKGYLYRLPMAAEWEYACRGGATTEEECSYHFYFERPTIDLSSNQANFNGEYPVGKGEMGPYLGRPTKVGSYAPNKLGLYDMHGNVCQWTGPMEGSLRTRQGGSWWHQGSNCVAARRLESGPTDRRDNYGFRLARVPVKRQDNINKEKQGSTPDPTAVDYQLGYQAGYTAGLRGASREPPFEDKSAAYRRGYAAGTRAGLEEGKRIKE